MQFLQTFKDLCKAKGVSQKQALEDMRLNRNAAQPWVKGVPSSDTLKKISEYFGVSVDFLLGAEQESKGQKNPATENDSGMSAAKLKLIQKIMLMSDADLASVDLLLQVLEAKKSTP